MFVVSGGQVVPVVVDTLAIFPLIVVVDIFVIIPPIIGMVPVPVLFINRISGFVLLTLHIF